MRNVSMLRDRRRLVKTGQTGPAEKGAENPAKRPFRTFTNKGK